MSFLMQPRIVECYRESTIPTTNCMNRGKRIINSDFCWLAFWKPSSNLCVPLESAIVNLVLITCVICWFKKESTKLFTSDKLWKGMLACMNGVFLPETLGNRSLVRSSFQEPERWSSAGVSAPSVRPVFIPVGCWIFTWLHVSVCDLLHGNLGWRPGFEVTLTNEGGDYLFTNHKCFWVLIVWWTLTRGWICKAGEDTHIPVHPDSPVKWSILAVNKWSLV